MRRGKERETVVSLSGVGCTTASGKRILDGIDLDVRRGECVLIIGRSGSGKTTVTKCINGLIPSFESGIELEGQVRVCGLDPSACEMYELAEHVGSVFQNPKSQFFCLTSNDELAFGLETRGVPVDEIERRIEETVEALGAQRLVGRDVSTMSGGEKQSLVFASVDGMDPDVYVLVSAAEASSTSRPRTSTPPRCAHSTTRSPPCSPPARASSSRSTGSTSPRTLPIARCSSKAGASCGSSRRRSSSL